MSRIGKLPIILPKGVTIKIEKGTVVISGPFGNLARSIPPDILINIDDNKIIVGINNTSKKTRALHGLFRTLLNNMVIGVSTKFAIELQLKGVGYRCQSVNNKIILNLGFSHPIELPVPSDIEVAVDANTNIKISGIDKEKVGFFASKIRSFRKPEPYNGKGVLYKNEVVLQKAGKSGRK